jgi:hypothetical protein
MRLRLALLLMLIVQPAQAQDPFGSNSFWSGLLHSWVSPAHILALAGLALQGGLHAPAARRILAACLALGLLGGSIAISRGLGETPASVILLVIAGATGALAAMALAAPLLLSALLVTIAGAALALDSPPQAVRISAALLIQLGTGLGALIAWLVLSEIVARTQYPLPRLLHRVLGAWIAAIVMLTLALRLAR